MHWRVQKRQAPNLVFSNGSFILKHWLQANHNMHRLSHPLRMLVGLCEGEGVRLSCIRTVSPCKSLLHLESIVYLLTLSLC